MSSPTYDFGSIGGFARVKNAGKIELAARFGYAAKGFVYAALGALALLAVFGFASGRITDTRGAIEAFNGTAWGPFVLALIAAGLAGFTLWRMVQAFRDTEDKGSDFSGLMQRAGLFGSGLIYASLAVFATKLLLDMNPNNQSADQRAADVMAYDGGTALVLIAGLIILGIALRQGYRVVTADYRDNWRQLDMSAGEERTAAIVSGFGIGARAVAFALIGGFLCWAAVTGQPGEAQGMEGTLNELAAQTYGQLLVGIAGLGLVCYGIYCFVNAFFREIDETGD